MGFAYRSLAALDALRIPESLKVVVALGFVVSLSAYQVLTRPQKAGHDALSSEKPQALRNETERTIQAEKAKAAASLVVPSSATQLK